MESKQQGRQQRQEECFHNNKNSAFIEYAYPIKVIEQKITQPGVIDPENVLCRRRERVGPIG